MSVGRYNTNFISYNYKIIQTKVKKVVCCTSPYLPTENSPFPNLFIFSYTFFPYHMGKYYLQIFEKWKKTIN